MRTSLIAALGCAAAAAAAYTPVVFMHGIGGKHTDGLALKAYLERAHPGQRVELLALNEDSASFRPMYFQVPELAEALRALQRNFSSGGGNGTFHLVGHSQGGLLSRAVLEAMDDHAVESFVSLGGPQQGVIGIPPTWVASLPAWLQRELNVAASPVLYTPEGQQRLSFANYWHDPDPAAGYLQRCAWLPSVDNRVRHKRAAAFKANFLRTRRALFVGGPDDGVIVPWQSTQFGFYVGSVNASRMVDMEQLPVYTDDTFGLRSMDADGRLHRLVVPNVTHMELVRDARVLGRVEPFLR